MDLRHGTTTARIDLEGGRLASLRPDGIEVLVTEGERPTRWGSFPMVPWCGRLRDGILEFDGAVHEFPLSSPPHANHGFTHIQAWREVSSDDTSLEIETGLGGGWPFGGRAVQRFTLSSDRLLVEIEVHADEQAMPAMAGWHPWFRRDLGIGGPAQLDVDLDGASAYTLADDGIPTGGLGPVPSGPWDACFVGLGSDPVVRWPGALALTVSSTFDHWVIYTQPEHALCVEPESGAPNDINRAPQVVQPGEALTGSMTLSWAAEVPQR